MWAGNILIILLKIPGALKPYYIQDARFSYTLTKKFFKETNFIFQVNNVFNKKYEPNGYTYSYFSQEV